MNKNTCILSTPEVHIAEYNKTSRIGGYPLNILTLVPMACSRYR